MTNSENTQRATPESIEAYVAAAKRVAFVEAGRFDRLAGAFVPSGHSVTITAQMTRRGYLSLQRRARRYGRDLGCSHVRVTQNGVTEHYFTESC